MILLGFSEPHYSIFWHPYI